MRLAVPSKYFAFRLNLAGRINQQSNTHSGIGRENGFPVMLAGRIE